jgi:hypothetical protein
MIFLRDVNLQECAVSAKFLTSSPEINLLSHDIYADAAFGQPATYPMLAQPVIPRQNSYRR